MSAKNSTSRIVIIVLCVIAAIAFVIGVPACSYHNKFVNLNQDVDQSWAEVQNTYQRRADLIPNLVNTVKGYAEHEKSTLQNVTDARAGLTTAYNEATEAQAKGMPQDEATMQQYDRAQQNLKGAFDIYVNAVHEAYPQLVASQNFTRLQDELAGTENRITEARRQYTMKVQDYNKSVQTFPGNMFAGMFGYNVRPQFQADANAQSAPKVEF